ncbi:MAG: SDR family NAD(P)-dependent oxidoreductase, partial [Proteobacteria bacterium]|nr:SDR family NAD(P)-dependent oxidoreductase [Pseudomonadota bacterium]
EPVNTGMKKVVKPSYTPFNRPHYQESKFCIFLVADLSVHQPVYREEGLHLATLEAGYLGQVLMDHQSEFNIGLCPIGGLRFERIEPEFRLPANHMLLHSFTAGCYEFTESRSDHLLLRGKPKRLVKKTTYEQSDLAIVGVSGRFPGAPNLQQYWENLKEGKRSIAPMPETRKRLLPVENKDRVDQQDQVGFAGYLDNIDCFDHQLFRISPVEARTMDPQERLMLETVWECLEDAGIDPQRAGEILPRTGVFMGVMWGDYFSLGLDEWHRSSEIKSLAQFSSITNRLSHYFDFKGPSIALDTSCSSALTAIHLACDSIQRGDCDSAIVGGVNIMVHPYHGKVLTHLDLLSKTDKTCAFSAEGTGWCPGEGVGAILIRPCDHSAKAANNVHALIKGTHVSHYGHTKRFGMPNVHAQEDSINKAISNAGMKAEDISYVESAATGSSIADTSEFSALSRVFGEKKRSDRQKILIGSVKPNIGHLESASGISQVIKVLLQFKNKQIAPTIDCDPINPLIDIDNSPFALNKELQPWETDQPTALVNSFGATGSSGHIVLQGIDHPKTTSTNNNAELITLSAASSEQLAESAGRLLTILNRKESADLRLEDISQTLKLGRYPMRHRLALVVDNTEDLKTRLERFKAGNRDDDRIIVGETDKKQSLQSPVSEHSDLDKLAREWVMGTPVNWMSHTDRKTYPLSLPTYPFARHSHWLLSREQEDTSLSPAKSLQNAETIQEQLEGLLTTIIAEEFELPVESIENDTKLQSYGLNSILIKKFNFRVERLFSQVSTTLLYECDTIRELSQHMLRQYPDKVKELFASDVSLTEVTSSPERAAPAIAKNQQVQMVQNSPIAIIGVSGRYPMAANLDQFWQNLVSGKDCISEIPLSRWNHADYAISKKEGIPPVSNRWGGFLEDVDKFDPLFFNISALEAENMDPQERLFLETAWETLEDSGHNLKSLQTLYNNQVGVFVGVMYGEYQLYGAEETLKGNTTALDSFYGSIANRVSYFLDLQGPSLAIDTMCSSSLTAVHLALSSIHSGECQVALVGGVNLSLHPNKYIGHARLNMSSSDGRCHSFGEGGDGFVSGEGVGAVMLKPLEQALQDGDQVYAVIESSAVNHGGNTSGFTVPSPGQQGALVKQAMDKAGLHPDLISYIEAHGTGTSLGDPIEITGLGNAFAGYSRGNQTCAIGSVKSNIGHLEGAAGIAGITKVLLQMKYQTLVPSIHAETLNTNIHFETTPFKLQRELAPWSAPESGESTSAGNHLRRAGISSFGAGGTNTHLILKEFVSEGKNRQEDTADPVIIPLSAKTPEALKSYCEKLLAFLRLRDTTNGENGSGSDSYHFFVPIRADDLAYTFQVGREAMEERLALVISSIDELTRILKTLVESDLNTEGHPGCFRGSVEEEVNYTATRNQPVHTGELNLLAQSWVEGDEVDWEALYADLEGARQPKKISVPTYPFERDRYWVKQVEKPLQGVSLLHPLLGENRSTFFTEKFSSRFSGNEFFFKDHQVNGSPMLPGAAIIEMARAAGTIAAETDIVKIRNISWHRPVHPDQMTMELTPEGYDRAGFQLISQNGSTAKTIHAEGQLEFTGEDSSGSMQIDLQAIEERCSKQIDSEVCYRLFKQNGLQYGEAFRTIYSCRVNGVEALTELRLPIRQQTTFSDFLLHPSLLDGAFQSTIGADFENNADQSEYLPYTVGEIELLNTIPETCFAHVTKKTIQSADKGKVKRFDIAITDNNGNIAVSIKDFCVKRVEKPAIKDLRKESADLYLMHRPWKAASLRDSDTSQLSGKKPGRSLLVFDTEDNWKQQLSHVDDMSEWDSAKIIRVTSGEHFLKHGEGHFQINPFKAEHYVDLIQELTYQSLYPDQIVHAWSMQDGNKGSCIEPEQLQSGFYSIFFLAQALMTQENRPKSNSIDFLYLFSTIYEGSQPLFSAVDSLLKTIQIENPRFHCKSVEIRNVKSPVKDNNLPTLAGLAAKELNSESDEAEVRYDIGEFNIERRIRKSDDANKIEESPDPSTAESRALKTGGTYLITGALGGLGKIFSEYIAGKADTNLVLVDFILPPKDRLQQIEKLKQKGIDVLTIQCDLGDPESVQKMVTEAKARFGKISGVIHAAGCLRDAYLIYKTSQQVEEVLAPKVQGTVYLDEALSEEKLDFFVMFSSLTATLGNLGQADYTFANRFMDSFADYREQLRASGKRHGKSLALAWSFWADGGMNLDEATLDWLENKMGLLPLSTKKGLEAFEKGLRADVNQLLVIEATSDCKVFDLGISDSATAGQSKVTKKQPATLPATEENAALKAQLDNFLTGLLEKVTKLPRQKLHANKAFEKFGINSIMIS